MKKKPVKTVSLSGDGINLDDVILSISNKYPKLQMKVWNKKGKHLKRKDDLSEQQTNNQ